MASDYLALLDWNGAASSSTRAFAPTTCQSARGAAGVAVRDELFGGHPQLPLDEAGRGDLEGLELFPYDPRFRVLAEVDPCPQASLLATGAVRAGERHPHRARSVGA